MAVKKKLFLISIPFILAYLYFNSTRIPTLLNQVHTSNYLAREPKKSKIPVALNQDQAINELDPDCQCRHVVPKGVQHHLLEKRSTCSQHATDRGPEQKVISYSFYGPLTSAYFNGIFENLAGVRMYYPDYVMRLYLDRSKAMSDNIENYQKLCQLFCRETNFDLCDVNEIEQYPELSKKFGMVWRFAPMADPLVSEWHCRDLDSRISERELAAVKNWQISNKTYHIMRDNKYHVATIVGGCFGMRSDIKTRPMHQQDFDKMLDFVKHMQVRYNSLKTVVEFQSTSSEFQLTFTLEAKELNQASF